MKTDAAQLQKPAGGTESFNEAAECLRILAHPVRLRMVQMLLHGRYSVGQLAEDAGIPDNVASEHLRLMQRCGFFTSEKQGRRVFYQIAEPHLQDLMNCVESRSLLILAHPAPRRQTSFSSFVCDLTTDPFRLISFAICKPSPFSN